MLWPSHPTNRCSLGVNLTYDEKPTSLTLTSSPLLIQNPHRSLWLKRCAFILLILHSPTATQDDHADVLSLKLLQVFKSDIKEIIKEIQVLSLNFLILTCFQHKLSRVGQLKQLMPMVWDHSSTHVQMLGISGCSIQGLLFLLYHSLLNICVPSAQLF